MNKAYWDGLANTFTSDVFEVFKNDSRGLIRSAIRDHGDRERIACDIGCGVGSLLPKLADTFGKVIAIDISSKCLQKAEENCGAFTNIVYLNRDLAREQTKIPKNDFSICVNALIFPSMAGRINFIDNSVAALKRGGILVLVVPALESALLRNHREVQWLLKTEGVATTAEQIDFIGLDGINAKKLSLGLVNIDGVKTKHFLKEEIMIMFEQRGMAVLEIAKLEYAWDTEFFKPPKWMQAPYPWDWFVLAKKK